MDETVERAIKAERAQHPLDEWQRLMPSERTGLIYRETQMIDAENSVVSSPFGFD